jgi:hypothetical protein
MSTDAPDVTPDYQPPPRLRLSLDDMSEVAYHRSRGWSWEAAARELKVDAKALRRALRDNTEYDAMYQKAKVDNREETRNEQIVVLRTQLRSDDPSIQIAASESLRKLLSMEERNTTRIEIARIQAQSKQQIQEMKGQAQLALAQLKAEADLTKIRVKAKAQADAKMDPQVEAELKRQAEIEENRRVVEEMEAARDPEEKRTRYINECQLREWNAKHAYEDRKPVYLWPGPGATPGRPPQEGDIRMSVIASHEHAAQGHGYFYWVVPDVEFYGWTEEDEEVSQEQMAWLLRYAGSKRASEYHRFPPPDPSIFKRKVNESASEE